MDMIYWIIDELGKLSFFQWVVIVLFLLSIITIRNGFKDIRQYLISIYSSHKVSIENQNVSNNQLENLHHLKKHLDDIKPYLLEQHSYSRTRTYGEIERIVGHLNHISMVIDSKKDK